MKANLPQAEPKMLARWEQEKLYHKIRASPRRPSHLRAARRPTVCERRITWALRSIRS